MPPRPKCSKEDIISVSYDLMKENGIDSVVAREVGKRLGTTTAPIFTYYESMQELKEDVYQLALKECLAYLNESKNCKAAYREFGHRWIKFAYENPNSYRLLFVSKRLNSDTDGFFNEDFDELLKYMYQEVARTYELSYEDAVSVVDNMSVYAQGIASFLVNGRGEYDEKTIDKQLARMCTSFVASLKIVGDKVDVDWFKRRLS